MGCEGSIRLAPHGNPTPITAASIYFLERVASLLIQDSLVEDFVIP
jgi:hypothetical protein